MSTAAYMSEAASLTRTTPPFTKMVTSTTWGTGLLGFFSTRKTTSAFMGISKTLVADSIFSMTWLRSASVTAMLRPVTVMFMVAPILKAVRASNLPQPKPLNTEKTVLFDFIDRRFYKKARPHPREGTGGALCTGENRSGEGRYSTGAPSTGTSPSAGASGAGSGAAGGVMRLFTPMTGMLPTHTSRMA